MAKDFRDRDMAGTKFQSVNLGQAKFEGVNLGQAKFEGVNLGRAKFENVNLGGASFRDVNLADVRIDDANIAGLTIFGVRVDLLVNSELDRRNPDTARFAKHDPHNPAGVRKLIGQLEKDRRRFGQALRRAEPRRLCKRPGKGRWSAIEHLRHLVFAEELYTDHWLLRNDRPFSGLGLLPRFLKGRPGFAEVGRKATKDLEVVMGAWQAVHERTSAFIARATVADLKHSTRDVDFGQGTVGDVLTGLARHDHHHIRKAHAALAAAAVS